MDQLPFEIKAKIVNSLSTSEAIKLRRLSKDWKALVDRHFKIRYVFISNVNNKSFHKYYGSDEIVDCQFIDGKKFSSSTIQWNQSCFANLKRLSVKVNFWTELKSDHLLGQLDQLKQLEHLEFGGQHFNIEGKHRLRLPNLKCFKTKRIHYFSTKDPNEPTVLSIDAPKLQKLRLDCSSTVRHLKFVHPSSVQCLESSFFADEFVSFTNLKFLFFSLDECQLDKIIKRNFLKKLPSLQKVYTGSEHIFEQLNRQKNKLQRTDLRLFLDGINLDNLDRLHSSTGAQFPPCKYQNCRSKICEFQVLNHQSSISHDSEVLYGLCDTLPFRTHIEYDHLEAYLKGGENLIDVKSSLSKLMRRFVNLEKMTVHVVQDRELFRMVIEICKKTIVKIRIMVPELQYNYIDWMRKLPNLSSRINALLAGCSRKNVHLVFYNNSHLIKHVKDDIVAKYKNKLEKRGVKIYFRDDYCGGFCNDWKCTGECLWVD